MRHEARQTNAVDRDVAGDLVAGASRSGSFLHQGSGRYQAPASYFLIRGDVNSHGSQMQPGFPAVLLNGEIPTAIPPANGKTSGRRLALAQWLGSPENPVTARVLINRIWHHHFGTGIVRTIDNFGVMGEVPSNPQLLANPELLAYHAWLDAYGASRTRPTLIIQETHHAKTTRHRRPDQPALWSWGDARRRG